MLIWVSVAALGVLFAALPFALGLLGIVAAAAIWAPLFAAVAAAVMRGRPRLFAGWGAAHLAGVLALPLVMMISVWFLPRSVAF